MGKLTATLLTSSRVVIGSTFSRFVSRAASPAVYRGKKNIIPRRSMQKYSVRPGIVLTVCPPESIPSMTPAIEYMWLLNCFAILSCSILKAALSMISSLRPSVATIRSLMAGELLGLGRTASWRASFSCSVRTVMIDGSTSAMTSSLFMRCSLPAGESRKASSASTSISSSVCFIMLSTNAFRRSLWQRSMTKIMMLIATMRLRYAAQTAFSSGWKMKASSSSFISTGRWRTMIL
mmetsp:Transcript_18868/g.56561  ORF Transcript_18868/g.56561 Transcript_18868/m.56561 type:complete len:235 (-) Transcript_18868:745-1449(-)